MDEATTRLLKEGNQARIDGDYAKARPMLQEAVDASPDVAECYWALGHVLINVGDFDEGIETFDRAVELEPGNQRFIVDLAKSLEMLGEFERARPLLEKVLELDSNTREAEEARKSLSYY